MVSKKLPATFTLGNLFLGIMAIILAFQELTEYAVLLIIVSMLLDGVDGRIARRLNVQSDFGKELDSLSDVISFGVAPIIIVYMAIFSEIEPAFNLDFLIMCLIIAMFPICSVVRLARYNVSAPTNYFDGLPITAAGTILACLSLLNSKYILFPCIIFLSVLMVSHVKYPAFKKKIMPKVVHIFIIVFLLVFIFKRFRTEPINGIVALVSIPLICYALYGFKTTFDYRRMHDKEEKD